MIKKKIIIILVSLLASSLLVAFGLYFFWAFPHAMVRDRYGMTAPPLYDALIGEGFSIERIEYIFKEWIPRYFEYFNKNLFVFNEKYFAIYYPLYDTQIAKFIRIFFLAFLGLFILLKALISKMPKILFILPFAFLIISDLVLGVWTSVQCVRSVFAEELGLRDMIYFDDKFYDYGRYNLTIDLWKGMTTNWSFFAVDLVALILVLASNKTGKVKSINKYAFLIPGILATLVVTNYISCNVWKMTNNIFGMELVALIIFAVAYYLMGWLLIKNHEISSKPAATTVATPIESETAGIAGMSVGVDEIDEFFLNEV